MQALRLTPTHPPNPPTHVCVCRRHSASAATRHGRAHLWPGRRLSPPLLTLKRKRSRTAAATTTAAAVAPRFLVPAAPGPVPAVHPARDHAGTTRVEREAATRPLAPRTLDRSASPAPHIWQQRQQLHHRHQHCCHHHCCHCQHCCHRRRKHRSWWSCWCWGRKQAEWSV